MQIYFYFRLKITKNYYWLCGAYCIKCSPIKLSNISRLPQLSLITRDCHVVKLPIIAKILLASLSVNQKLAGWWIVRTWPHNLVHPLHQLLNTCLLIVIVHVFDCQFHMIARRFNLDVDSGSVGLGKLNAGLHHGTWRGQRWGWLVSWRMSSGPVNRILI